MDLLKHNLALLDTLQDAKKLAAEYQAEAETTGHVDVMHIGNAIEVVRLRISYLEKQVKPKATTKTQPPAGKPSDEKPEEKPEETKTT